ncbi:YxiJ family protein [Planomicrobium okeanokoites]|uniref:YxiJ family protein n=1 Tax=Planomicrobium okeanokoites TaxID=244 RepID=UPI002491C63B|nr:YxiJ family protein [Planomicrobium okeanokoites]
MDKALRREAKRAYKELLSFPFPYEGLASLENTFEDTHPEIEEFTMDFNDFCTLVAGSCTYIIKGKAIPKYQASFLTEDFFTSYSKYTFLQPVLKDYPDISDEMMRYETVRKMLVENL